ncbi:hypothetical protein EAG_02631, partial [Camponotus floridanus]
NDAIGHISFNLLFYYRYADDVALAVPSFMFNRIVDIFNFFHPRFQF